MLRERKEGDFLKILKDCQRRDAGFGKVPVSGSKLHQVAGDILGSDALRQLLDLILDTKMTLSHND